MSKVTGDWLPATWAPLRVIGAGVKVEAAGYATAVCCREFARI